VKKSRFSGPLTSSLSPLHLRTAALCQPLAQTLGPYIGPVLFDVVQTRSAVRFAVNYPPAGWNVGDRIILTETRLLDDLKTDESQGSEQRLITSIDGKTLKLDHPLAQPHQASEAGRGEVASRSNGIVAREK